VKQSLSKQKRLFRSNHFRPSFVSAFKDARENFSAMQKKKFASKTSFLQICEKVFFETEKTFLFSDSPN